MAKTLGDRIKELRKASGMTQLELANKLHLTDKAVSKWEANEGNPDILILPELAKLFNVTTDYLLNGTKTKTISLDDMDDTKRKEYIIENDDLDNFRKYHYDNKRAYYTQFIRKFYIDSQSDLCLNKTFWDSIFKNKAYKIFKHCFADATNKIKTQHPIDSRQSFTYLLGNYINQFIDFCLEEDNSELLDIIGLKYTSIEDENNQNNTNFLPPSVIDKIVSSKDKAPKCFNYLIDLDFASSDWKPFHIRHHMLEYNNIYNEIPYYLVKYNLIKELNTFLEKYKNYEKLEKYKNYLKNPNGYIYSVNRDYSNDCEIYGYCITIPEKTIRLCISNGNIKLAKSLIEFNNDFNNKTNNPNEKAFVITENQFDVLCIELDQKLSKEEKNKKEEEVIKKQIAKANVLDIKLLDRLFEISTSDSTLEYCIKVLNAKPITYFEFVKNLSDSKKWRDLFTYTVDSNFTEATKLLIEKQYDDVCQSIFHALKQISYRQNQSLINSSYINYEYMIRNDLQNMEEYGKNVRTRWINNKTAKLKKYKFAAKMSRISAEITREEIEEEVKKGDTDHIQLAIIKLCKKLQAVLNKKFNCDQDVDLLDLLKKYREDKSSGSDENEISILNKLRIQRNNIVHPDLNKEDTKTTLTSDELQKAIDYVFKIN